MDRTIGVMIPEQNISVQQPIAASALPQPAFGQTQSSSRAEHTFPVRLLVGLVRALIECGEDAYCFLAKFGLTENLIRSTQRLPYSVAEKLYNAAAELVGDSAFGLRIGSHSDPLDQGEVATLYLSSDFEPRSLDRYKDVVRLQYDSSRILWQEKEDRIYIFHCMEGTSPSRTIDDAIMSSCITQLRAILGEKWTPFEIWFTYPTPQNESPYRDFFGCSLRFDMPIRAMALPRRIPELKRGTATIDSITEYWSQSAMNYQESKSTVHAVRKVLYEGRTDGRWDGDSVSSLLNVSRRTVERRLKAEGTSFRAVVNQMRYELARCYLQNNQRDLRSIAESLGFADIRAFSRAFKRWSGSTPVAYRKNGIRS